MSESHDIDARMENDYDEEADSDFDAAEANDDVISSSSGDEDADNPANATRPKKRRKTFKVAQSNEVLGELDSGDEATIREREKIKRKQKKTGLVEDSDGEQQGWRARTRAMRERDKDAKKKNKLANIQGSTIDVDKVWEEMNHPGGTNPPPPSVVHSSRRVDKEGRNAGNSSTQKDISIDSSVNQVRKNNGDHVEDHNVIPLSDDMITIKRTYKFAGELHTEEKIVPKISAEAQLWLSQQSAKDQPPKTYDSRLLRRPLRRISRFDPNLYNLDSIKKSWEKQLTGDGVATGPKLNTVEKSKMDWAAHVDQQGLKDELDEHAKAKEGYLSRMDFLGQVEQRRDEEARAARLRG